MSDTPRERIATVARDAYAMAPRHSAWQTVADAILSEMERLGRNTPERSQDQRRATETHGHESTPTGY